MIKFDSTQKTFGINEFGHYQFGTNSCPYCKNETTEPIPETKRRKCSACSVEWTPKVN